MAYSILVSTKLSQNEVKSIAFDFCERQSLKTAGFSGVTMFFYAGGDLPQDPK